MSLNQAGIEAALAAYGSLNGIGALHGEKIERAILAYLSATRPTTPDAELVQRVETAMLDAWNDICSDTGNHPLDITHGGGTRLEFSPGHWARGVATRLSAQAVSISEPQAARSTVDASRGR